MTANRFVRTTFEMCRTCLTSQPLSEVTLSTIEGAHEVHVAECGHEIRRDLMNVCALSEATETH